MANWLCKRIVRLDLGDSRAQRHGRDADGADGTVQASVSTRNKNLFWRAIEHVFISLVAGFAFASTFAQDVGSLIGPSAAVVAVGAWSSTGPLSISRASHQATLLSDGRVLVSGGQSSGIGIASSEIFDPQTNAWTLSGSNGSARYDHTATLLSDGRVLVVGGVGFNTCTSNSTAEFFDPASGTWSEGPSAPVAIGTGHSAIRLNDGRILVSGGGDRCGGVFPTSAVFNPATNSWTAAGNMNVNREFHSSVLLPDGRVLVAGGVGQNDLFMSIADAEIFDPNTNTWSVAPPMATPRNTACNSYMEPYLATLPGGKFLAAAAYRTVPPSGCLGSTSPALSNSAEVFDAAAGSWSPTGGMSVVRSVTTLAPLTDGRVLVAGGYDGTQSLASAEVYDPTTSTWISVASMSEPRSGHTATRLQDGRVLVVSGVTAEIFSLGASGPTWTELHPVGAAPPHATTPKSVFYEPSNNRLIAFFPGNPIVQPFGNEVWILTNANGLGSPPEWQKLTPLGTPPSSNVYESVIYDSATNRLVVYGGCFANCSPALSDVFVLTNANGLGGIPEWLSLEVSNPQPRDGHSAVYDSASNRMIAFGGGLAFFGTDQSDTRVLSNANGTGGLSNWTTLTTLGGPPGIREQHTAVYDEASRKMVVFGGTDLIRTCCPYVISDYNDAWLLSNAEGLSGVPSWTQIALSGSAPPVRGYHSAVYDRNHDRMIVFGGMQWNQTSQTNTVLGDLWELRGAMGAAAQWAELPQSGQAPGPRYNHGAGWDSTNQRMIVLSGADGSFQVSHRVWILDLGGTAPPQTNRSPIANAGATRAVSVGTFVTLNGSASSDPDGDALAYSWQIISKPNGSAAALSGADTATPSFVADLVGSYLIQLDVTDPSGASSSAVVTITANFNSAPVAVIAPVTGPITVPTSVVLDGRGSIDPDGDTITFSWTLNNAIFSGGSGATLANPLTAQPTLTITRAGTYTVTLRVGDGRLFSAPVTFKVKAVAGTPPPRPPPPTPTVPRCVQSQGAGPNGSTVIFYQCDGRRISQDATIFAPGGLPTDLLDMLTLYDNNSVATWRFGDETGPTLAFSGQFAYYANCTRRPLATPVQVTDQVRPPNTIENLRIVGGAVHATLCTSNGCIPMRARPLPVGCP